MYTSDKKMLELKEYLKNAGIIRFDREFCAAIDMLPQNLYSIQNPEKTKRMVHFTPQHIENACKYYDVDAAWIFGQTDKMFLKTWSEKMSTSGQNPLPKTKKIIS